ncbi:MAG: cytochrome c [Acidobacteriia bacterium]|nr:cytochrome c [Terriglobia bacterium]
MRTKMMLGLLVMVTFAGIASAQDAAAGKALFASTCAVCHGADASANTTMGKTLKIPNFHTPEVQKQSDAELTAIITKGKGKVMPAFEGKLTREQMSQLVAYIREVGKQQ